MKRLLISIIFLILFTIPVFGQNIKVQGIAAKGGKIVRTSAQVQHTLMETYPSCTITVYLTGTLTLASIFSDEIGTVKSNPFTANTDASWFFYVATGRYDIKFSGTGILTPFTISDYFVDEGGGGGGDVESVFGRTGIVVAQTGDYDFNQLDFTGSNFNSIETRSASDLNAGTLPDARFPAILPVISGQNLTTLNASNISSGTLNDTRLSSNVPLKNSINTFTANNIFTASVGINTSTPRRRLDVLDGTSAQVRLSAVDNSVYTDLFVDSGGTFNILPTGNVTFDTVGNQVNPLITFSENFGQINKKWLSIHAAELFVETLVAQNTVATIGGRIIVAPTNVLIADLSSAATTINVKYNNFANNDRVYMEGNSSVEFFAVTSGATTIPGGFSYTVTRNLDGTGANDWFAGDAMVNTGVAGDGFIDLYSVRGVKTSSQIGPTIVMNVRNSSTFNDWIEHTAFGNLNGIYGYGSDTYGIALGKYASDTSHITADSNNGIRIFHGIARVIGQWKADGNIVVGEVAVGQANIVMSPAGNFAIRENTTDKIRLNSDGTGFLANGNISWNSSGTLSIVGGAFISGWTIGSDTISSTGVNISSGADANLAFGTTPPTSSSSGTGIFINRTGLYGLNSGTQNFILNASNGTITAINANISGTITATAGSLSGLTITGTLTNSGGSVVTGTGNVILDSDGIRLSANNAGTSTTLKWVDFVDGSVTNASGLLATIRTGTPKVTTTTLESRSLTADSAGASILRFFASASDFATTEPARINLLAYGPSHASRASKRYVTIASGDGIIIENVFTDPAPVASVVLELKSTTGAFLPTRLTTTQRDALTPIDGMIFYNTTTGKHQARSAGAWVDMY